MIRLTLSLIFISTLGGCMTQADKLVWLEVKDRLGKSSDPVPAQVADVPEAN